MKKCNELERVTRRELQAVAEEVVERIRDRLYAARGALYEITREASEARTEMDTRVKKLQETIGLLAESERLAQLAYTGVTVLVNLNAEVEEAKKEC